MGSEKLAAAVGGAVGAECACPATEPVGAGAGDGAADALPGAGDGEVGGAGDCESAVGAGAGDAGEQTGPFTGLPAGGCALTRLLSTGAGIGANDGTTIRRHPAGVTLASTAGGTGVALAPGELLVAGVGLVATSAREKEAEQATAARAASAARPRM